MPDEHFHMSADYKLHSSSQTNIGKIVIESVVDVAKRELGKFEELKVLDLACGPGNLTIELKHNLEFEFPHTPIELTGLDYTADNVNRLVTSSNGEIKGIVGSFYEPLKLKNQDLITSNEGLHWQPPYQMSEIIYFQLPLEERQRYELWALKNFKKALTNIHNSLRNGGIAVLQFGHEGQLQKLWDVVGETISETQFAEYKYPVNFPLYYPDKNNLNTILSEVGFTNITVKVFKQNLTEKTPESIVSFLKAFTQPRFSKLFNPDDLNQFYSKINLKLAEKNLDEFRKNQWHRTLIKATAIQ